MMCSTREAVLNSRLLSNYFKELCADFLPPYRETSVWANQHKADLNHKLIFVIVKTDRLISEETIDAETFKNEIKNIKKLNILHVEVLWYLEFFKILTLKELIQFHESSGNEDVIQHIAQRVFENLLKLKINSSEISKRMLQCYFKTAFECLKHDASNGKTSFAQKLLSFILSNLKEFYGCEELSDIEGYINASHLEQFFNNPELDSDLIKQFLTQMLNGILESSQQGVAYIFKKQEKIKNNIKGKKILEFFIMMSKFCDLKFFITEIQIILLQKDAGINWDHMFCLITFVGMHYNDGWRDLRTMTNFILKEAFQKLNAKLLSHAFVVARQGCFEKLDDAFPSYLQWFCSTFSTETRKLISSRNACHFFFNFLIDVMPYESPYYLKVHLNRPPSVPTDCLSVLKDYIELVKTRLSDLNVSIELGICENTTNKSAAMFDVESVINHFQRTNDILSSVFQASMFCKEYYEKKFLVELLSKFEGKKSVRHKLILKLHSHGKIPNSMFKVYKGLEKNSK